MQVALHRLAIEGFWMVMNYASYGIAIPYPYGLIIQVIKKCCIDIRRRKSFVTHSW